MDDVLSFLKSYWKVLAGIVATIALVFKLDKLDSYTLHCQQESVRIENEVLEEVKNGESGGRGWRYSVEQAPAEGHTYQWRFTAIRK
jgi:hypothetical protein